MHDEAVLAEGWPHYQSPSGSPGWSEEALMADIINGSDLVPARWSLLGGCSSIIGSCPRSGVVCPMQISLATFSKNKAGGQAQKQGGETGVSSYVYLDPDLKRGGLFSKGGFSDIPQIVSKPVPFHVV